MKKILFLTPQLPHPPHQGTTIRNYNLIAQLAPRHEIHLLSLVASPPSAQSMEHLLSLCKSVHTLPVPMRSTRERAISTLLSPQPDMGLRLESPLAHQRTADLLGQELFDVIQVEGIEMAPYLLQAARLREHRPLLVFDDHNAEYVLQRRACETDVRKPACWPAAAYSFVQWQKLRRYERRACQCADRVVAVSVADARALRSLLPGLAVAVIPNGVDLSYYRADEPFPPLPASPSLVFTGKMDFRPNVDAVLWFYQQVLSRLQKSLPSPVHFYVVGQSPHPRLAPLAQDPHVTLTGYVNDVRPFIAGADVYVVPLRIGGGTRLKVLEAMAMGKAIVSTTLGCEGLGLHDGQEALLADTPAFFADRVLALLRDASQRRDLGQRARRFVEGRYDWQMIVPALERLYERPA